MESEILDETKALKEIKSKLRKVETTIIKKCFWRGFDEQKH